MVQVDQAGQVDQVDQVEPTALVAQASLPLLTAGQTARGAAASHTQVNRTQSEQ